MPLALQLVRSVVAPITRTRVFRATAPVWMPPVERLLAMISRDRVQLSSLLVPSLVLTTTGARSGEPRETVLMYTADGGGSAIVAGTSFARQRHPAWTYNLMANPDAVIAVRARRLVVRATRITGQEREAAWRRIEAQWPGYRAYERESGREVRLFRLRPVRELPSAPRQPSV